MGTKFCVSFEVNPNSVTYLLRTSVFLLDKWIIVTPISENYHGNLVKYSGTHKHNDHNSSRTWWIPTNGFELMSAMRQYIRKDSGKLLTIVKKKKGSQTQSIEKNEFISHRTIWKGAFPTAGGSAQTATLPSWWISSLVPGQCSVSGASGPAQEKEGQEELHLLSFWWRFSAHTSNWLHLIAKAVGKWHVSWNRKEGAWVHNWQT